MEHLWSQAGAIMLNHDPKTGRPDTLDGMYAIVTLR